MATLTAHPEVRLAKLPRLYVTQHLESGAVIKLDAGQSHYLKNVLRREAGDELRLFREDDGEFRCVMLPWQKKREAALVSIEELIRPHEVPSVHLDLYFCLLSKRQRLKLLLEKASELGASVLQPLWSQNTQDKGTHASLAAWRRQLVESAEQSERMDVAHLQDPVMALSALLDGWAPDGSKLLVCRERSQQGEARPLLTAVQENLRRERGTGEGSRISLLVGPEGGFTQASHRGGSNSGSRA